MIQIQTHLRKIRRDMASRKGRTALVASAIFVGVVGTVILFSMSDIILGQLKDTLAPNEISMVNVLVTVNTLVPLDNASYFETLQTNLSDITTLQASAQGALTFKLAADSEQLYNANMLSYSEDFDALKIEPIKRIDGTLPQRGQRELMVEQRFANRYYVGIGSHLWIEVIKSSNNIFGTPPQPTFEQWTITALVYHPYVLSPADTVYGYLSDNNYLTNTRGYNIWSARFNDYAQAHQQARDFTNLIATRTPYLPVYTQRQDPAYNPLIVGGERLANTLQTLALLTLFVSAFLVINVISTIITEQKRQIGAMKAIGASQLDIMLIYCGLALGYGILGVIPGILLGIPLGYWLAHLLALEVNAVVDTFRISWSAVGVGLIVGLALPLLASLPPVIAGTRISILDAMTDSGINATYRAGLLHFINWLPLNISVKQALRNLSLKYQRIGLTILTLSIAVGAFMAVYTLFGAVKEQLRLFLDDTSGNLIINADLQNDPELVLTTLKDYFENNPEALESLTQGFQLPVTIEKYEESWFSLNDDWDEVMAYGYDGEQLPMNLVLLEGEEPQPDNFSVVISERLAEATEVELGDTLTLTTLGRTSQVLVSGISDSPLNQIWMPATTMIELAGYGDFLPTLEQYVGQAQLLGHTLPIIGVSAALNDRFSQIPYPDQGEVWITQDLATRYDYQVGDLITLETSPNTQNYTIAGIYELDPQIADIIGEQMPASVEIIAMNWQDLASLEGREFNDLPQAYFLDDPNQNWEDIFLDQLQNVLLQRAGIPTTLFNFVGILEALNNNLTVFQAILSSVALLIGIVGGLGLLLTLSMSVYERQREIGVMRSIGASSEIIALQFIIEGLMVGVIAWVLGIPISYGMTQLLLQVTGLEDTLDNAYFSYEALGLGFIGMVVLTALASFIPAWRAANRTVSDILRYQ